ncbi:MAG: sporulation protein [Paenisporosarcina sp.]
MSIFNKVLASVGVGNAKVNTKLTDSIYIAGNMISGISEVTGGHTSQEIESIYLKVFTTYERESNDQKFTDSVAFFSHKLNEPFTIQKDEVKTFPFSFQLPLITPVTMGKTRVWISTSLDIKNSVDPGDKDFIEIRPNSFVQAGLNAAQNLGFTLRKVDCEEAPRAYKGMTKFIQEFEFVVLNGPFKGKLDEIELVFIPKGEDQYELLVQVDRRVKGIASLFSEAAGLDESYFRINLSSAEFPQLESRLKQAIGRYV